MAQIWRYPVSSVGGELLTNAHVNECGIVGDRRYALVDEITGLSAHPEREIRWRRSLYLRAAQLTDEQINLSFPDGSSFEIANPALKKRLYEYFEFPVAVAIYDQKDNVLGLPRARHRHKHFPLHVLATSSLGHLAMLRNVDSVDVRRFRPNLLIANEPNGFAEKNWIGREMQLDRLQLFACEETKRCGVTLISQPGLDEDPEILRSILKHNKRHLGAYCSVTGEGPVQLGDDLTIDG